MNANAIPFLDFSKISNNVCAHMNTYMNVCSECECKQIEQIRKLNISKGNRITIACQCDPIFMSKKLSKIWTFLSKHLNLVCNTNDYNETCLSDHIQL